MQSSVSGKAALVRADHQSRGKMTSPNLRLSNDHLAIVVSPMGAELRSLCTADGVEFLWQGDEATWLERSPLLFPLHGRPRDGLAVYEGQSYPFERHGFARTQGFEPTGGDETSVRFSLSDNAETRVSFPYGFELAAAYTLSGATLTIEAVVTNRETARAMPFSFGFHPGFAWPLPGNETKEGHSIHLVSSRDIHLHRLVDGNVMGDAVESWPGELQLPLDESLFRPSAMILKGASPRALSYRGQSGPVVRIATENFPNLGIWSTGSGRFVCIEPWSALPQAASYFGDVAGRPDVTVLAPGEQARFAMHITIDADGEGA